MPPMCRHGSRPRACSRSAARISVPRPVSASCTRISSARTVRQKRSTCSVKPCGSIPPTSTGAASSPGWRWRRVTSIPLADFSIGTARVRIPHCCSRSPTSSSAAVAPTRQESCCPSSCRSVRTPGGRSSSWPGLSSAPRQTQPSPASIPRLTRRSRRTSSMKPRRILQEFVTRRAAHVPALIKLVEVCVDGGLESTMYEAQTQLADAYLTSGQAAEARAIAEDLVAREPWEGAHIERFRRALVMLRVSDPDTVIAERLSGSTPFVARDHFSGAVEAPAIPPEPEVEDAGVPEHRRSSAGCGHACSQSGGIKSDEIGTQGRGRDRSVERPRRLGERRRR